MPSREPSAAGVVGAAHAAALGDRRQPALGVDLHIHSIAGSRRPLWERALPPGVDRILSDDPIRPEVSELARWTILGDDDECAGVAWIHRAQPEGDGAGTSGKLQQGAWSCHMRLHPLERANDHAAAKVLEDLRSLRHEMYDRCFDEKDLPPRDLIEGPSLSPAHRRMLREMIRDHRSACRNPSAPRSDRID